MHKIDTMKDESPKQFLIRQLKAQVYDQLEIKQQADEAIALLHKKIEILLGQPERVDETFTSLRERLAVAEAAMHEQ